MSLRISHSEMQRFVNKINDSFPVNALWDGYKIRKFKKKNLVIGGSQDWIYYHNIDIIFKKVSFFNLPAEWRDTWVNGESLFRLSTSKEFNTHFPDFNVGGKHVFAFDLNFPFNQFSGTYTYFVLATNVFFERLSPAGDGDVDYEDPLGHPSLSNKQNRVLG